MKFEYTVVHGFVHSLMGMRNPMESWTKSDSEIYPDFFPGKKDIELAQKLIKAGSEHRKFMRQIVVWVDIVAPLYWWKEFDTYKVGTTANSTSTMHKLSTTPITKECFEHPELVWDIIVDMCENQRKKYLETKDKMDWEILIVNLPESWLQRRTVTMNYENIYSMIKQRENHKLTEWSEDFINWAKSLPYSVELLFI